jgi:hypothetical protein
MSSRNAVPCPVWPRSHGTWRAPRGCSSQRPYHFPSVAIALSSLIACSVLHPDLRFSSFGRASRGDRRKRKPPAAALGARPSLVTMNASSILPRICPFYKPAAMAATPTTNERITGMRSRSVIGLFVAPDAVGCSVSASASFGGQPVRQPTRYSWMMPGLGSSPRPGVSGTVTHPSTGSGMDSHTASYIIQLR